MSRIGIQYIDFSKIATSLLKEKKEVPTLEKIKDTLDSTPSNSTLVKFMRQWKEERILLSSELGATAHLQLSAGSISKHFEEIWHDLNQVREQEIAKKLLEKDQKIAMLETTVAELTSNTKKFQEDIQLFQKQCDNYQLNDLKQGIKIKDLEKERDLLQERLQEAEHLFPSFKEEVQKRVNELQNAQKEALQGFLASEEYLKQKHVSQVNALVDQLHQSTVMHEQIQLKLQKDLEELRDHLSATELKYRELHEKYEALQLKHVILENNKEKEEDLTQYIKYCMKSSLEEDFHKNFTNSIIALLDDNIKKTLNSLENNDSNILKKLDYFDKIVNTQFKGNPTKAKKDTAETKTKMLHRHGQLGK